MSKLSSAQKEYLSGKFKDRVTFDDVERMLYSHDIAAMPSLIKPLIGDTTPDAVVQPSGEEELRELAAWAAGEQIPLTPRGKASSGYGGVLPVKQGIVVDFFRMKKVVSIDKGNLSATVQPGILWEHLDKALKKEGLTLLTYPSSYPGSTVGGWLAQGGAGFGSYEAGWFRDIVTSARVVGPDGSVHVFEGKDLDLVSEAEGTTGFISEVTIRVQPDEEMDVVSIGCPNPGDLQKMMEAMIREDLPIWSLVFINPKMAEMKNQAPLMEHWGHPAEERVLLPASYITTLTYRVKDRQKVMDGLGRIIKLCEAEILSEKIAHHEWKHRFKLMVVKRLGPSLVPAEVVIPLASFGKFMQKVERTIRQPVVKEGVIIRKTKSGRPEVVILGFIPGDERDFSYNFVFGLSLSMMRLAERYGGRAYSTGLYFTTKAKDVLGRDRLKKLREYKKQVDPKGILNPGKVLGGTLIGSAVRLGSIFEPLIRPFGNAVFTRVGERPQKDVRDIPADVAWYAYSCSQCGYCVDECDQFYGRGWESQSPRGKWYWLREYMKGKQEWSQKMVDTFLVCTTCELCNFRCSAALPIEPSWMKLRGRLIHEEKKMTFPPFEMMAEAALKEGNIWAGYRKDRSAWFPEDLREKHGPGKKAKAVYFAGCTASYVEPDIGMASVRLLDAAGVDFTYVGNKENCCGTPMLVAGKWEVFEEIMRRNLAAVKETGADTVIASCPACDMMWRHVYPTWAKKLGIDYDIKAVHYSEVLSEKIASGEFTFPDTGQEPVTVTWHDSCHIGRVSGVYEPPRDLIKAIPHARFVEMSHHHAEAHCCGSVLTLIKEPPVAADIGEDRLNEAVEAGASKVLALCPCCEFQLRVSADKKQVPVEVVDLARFASSALGYDFPDPNPEVQRQWAVFEAMIALMTPQGFADLMSTMWPELIRAMPLGMGPMMKVMGKIPGALNLMKPLFPVLFPRLLPMMMPKVMPVMLEKVSERIPMPDYMREQMPEIMPKVMDSLMPHMIGDVVPLVTQPMIDYLQGRAAR
ncbi:MAG TPA: FAD-binding and (Fe-S)-binding domain-containing protein [Deltaproteobacteria bacterium]|nr:FAD-binding and (Fe-S)-binding domain-containing protein [Deltaproteobacteria bacterium]